MAQILMGTTTFTNSGANGTNYTAQFTVNNNLFSLLFQEQNNLLNQSSAQNCQVVFADTNGNLFQIYFNPSHNPGAPGELEFLSAGSLCIKASQFSGIGFNYPSWNRGIQIGGPTDIRNWLYLASDHAVQNGFGTINNIGTSGNPNYGSTNTLGWSTPLLFYANTGVGYNGGGSSVWITGFQFRMSDTNGNGSLNLYDNLTAANGSPGLNSSNTDWAMGGMTPRFAFRVGGTNAGFSAYGYHNFYGADNALYLDVGTNAFQDSFAHFQWNPGVFVLTNFYVLNAGDNSSLFYVKPANGTVFGASQVGIGAENNTAVTLNIGANFDFFSPPGGYNVLAKTRIGDFVQTFTSGAALEVGGNGDAWVTNGLAVGPIFGGPTNSWSAITNNGMVWYSWITNGPPNIAAPPGSICTTASGAFYVCTNSLGTILWIQH